MVVTGAMGGLAAATVAASGAFACTPQSRLDVTGAHDGAVVPGQTVDIKVDLIDADANAAEVEVSWWDTAPMRQREVLIARAPARSFVGVKTPVTIPASPARADAPYAVVVSLYTADNPNQRQSSAARPAMLYVVPPQQLAPAPQPQPQPSVTPDAELTRANAPEAAAVTRPDGTRAPAAAPAPGVNVPVGSTNGAPVAAGAPARASVPTQQPASAPAPGTAAAVPATQGISLPAAGEPARATSPLVADLWSGLEADRPSLLDAPATTEQRTAPVGGILLGAGVLALAGVALAATRRRVAVAVRR